MTGLLSHNKSFAVQSLSEAFSLAILALHGGAGGDGPWRGLTDLDPQRLQCLEDILS